MKLRTRWIESLVTGQIYDPLTTDPAINARTPFSGNIIPPCVGSTRRSATVGSCLDPAAPHVLNLFPQLNIPGAGTGNDFQSP